MSMMDDRETDSDFSECGLGEAMTYVSALPGLNDTPREASKAALQHSTHILQLILCQFAYFTGTDIQSLHIHSKRTNIVLPLQS